MAAMAQSLPADATKVIYRQDTSTCGDERPAGAQRPGDRPASLRKGRGLWRSASSHSKSTTAHRRRGPALDTDQRMDVGRDYEVDEGMDVDEEGTPLPEWLAA